VHLGATTVVWLESSLAHSCSPLTQLWTPEEVGGQTAGSQLVKNTALNRVGQTNGPKRPIIHNILFEVGSDTLWTTKVKVSHSGPPEQA
jgi:hypothetical protein